MVQNSDKPNLRPFSKMVASSSAAPLSRAAIVVILVISALYFWANNRGSSAGDNFGTRALAASLAAEGSFDLTPALAEAGPNYSVQQVGDALRVAYPPGTGILAAPVYFAAQATGSRTASALFASTRVEKVAAVILCILTVACFLSLANQGWSAATTIAATALLVAGTPVLTTMSQGLWSHTGELLLLALALWLARAALVSRFHGLTAGLAAGLAVWCRPTAVLIFPLPLALLDSWRERLRFAIGACTGIAGLVALNLAWFGSLAGPYGGDNRDRFDPLAAESFGNLYRVLFSPSRGLVWFFPALLISLAVLLRKSESSVNRRVPLALTAVTGLVVVTIASYFCWWGGNSVGPRLLAELSLPCALAFGAALEVTKRRALRYCLLAAGGLQIVFSSALHFAPDADAWNIEVAINANPAARMSFKDSQLRAAFDRSWTYQESGTYFDEAVLAQARSNFDWQPVDLRPFADARYDLPLLKAENSSGKELYLARLAQQPPPATSHLRVLPPGAANALRVCAGEGSAAIPIANLPTQKIDTLIQYRGSPLEEQQAMAAGVLMVSFANGKESRYPLRFGNQILLRSQLNSIYARHRSRFFTGSMAAPDALQRQRFSLAGRLRQVVSLRLEMPADGPGGCLYLLAVSLGKPGSPR
jgi:hypothetical protein